jgi:hypothetical protein
VHAVDELGEEAPAALLGLLAAAKAMRVRLSGCLDVRTKRLSVQGSPPLTGRPGMSRMEVPIRSAPIWASVYTGPWTAKLMVAGGIALAAGEASLMPEILRA